MTHNEFNYNVLTDIFKYLLDGDVDKLISQLRKTEKRITNEQIMFRFNDNPMLYTIRMIEADLKTGTQRNREFINHLLIESVRLTSELEIIS